MPDAAPPTSEDALKADDASFTTVEELVRRQLSRALGGIRGTAEGAVPTLGFSLGLAIVLLLVRLVQRSTVQFVLNSLVGITVAAVFALRSGRAEDAFLPGLIYNTVYALGLSASALTRWPLDGFMIGAVTGDPTGWRRDPQL